MTKILLFIEIFIIMVIRFDELSISLIIKFIFNVLFNVHLIKKCNI